jgi:tight adherence protein C
MNTLLLIIGLLLTAAAVALVARGVIAARLRAVDTLGNIGRYGFRGVGALEPAAGLRGWFDDFAGSIGNLLLRKLQFGDEDRLRKNLISAGMYRTTPRMLMGYQLVGGIALPVLWLWLSVAGGLKTGLVVIGLIAALLIGWMAPRWYVQQAASKRLNQIDYDMPELIDLLVVTVEAGLGLGASLQLASTRLGGPLGEELRIATREQTMGLPLLSALENMQNRCPTPAVRSFVRAMVQGERLGISIGQILRSLALEMRKRRRAKAEEKAQKAPIKILFPLIFLIFPAMFLVLLGPALFSIFDALKGK